MPVRERKQVNNKLYIFGKDGRLVKKKGLYKHGKTQVYINKDGSLATGLVKIKGKWYWFEDNGVLSTKKRHSSMEKPHVLFE